MSHFFISLLHTSSNTSSMNTTPGSIKKYVAFGYTVYEFIDRAVEANNKLQEFGVIKPREK